MEMDSLFTKTPRINVLSIGSDRNLFVPETSSRKRIIEYGALFRELHIIVFSRKKLGLKKERIAPNIWLYPTNSFSKWLYVFDALAIARRLRAKKEIGVVSAQDPFESGLVSFCAAKILRAPLHLQVHTDLFSPFFKKGALLNAFRIRLAVFLFSRASGIRVVSARIKDSIVRKFAGRKIPNIAVLPIFIDAEAMKHSMPSFDLHEKYPQFPLIALVVSRLEPEKNISFAIELLAHATKNGVKDVGLVVVGTGRLKESLQKQAARRGISDRVIFEGQTFDLASYYKTADILFVTSLYEGYGMVVVEAFFSGCPILSFDVGIASEMLSYKNEMVCSAGDRDCMKKEFMKWASVAAFREELRVLAAKSAEEKKSVSKEAYLAAYQKTLEAAASRVSDSVKTKRVKL